MVDAQPVNNNIIIPSGLKFDTQPNINFPCRTKQYNLQPQSSPIGNIQPNQNVFFTWNMQDLIDPWGTFLHLQVDISQNPHVINSKLNTGNSPGVDQNLVLQLDSSGHSFINQLLLTARGQVVLENILEYDTLMAVLMDVYKGDPQNEKKGVEGLGSAQDLATFVDGKAPVTGFTNVNVSSTSTIGLQSGVTSFNVVVPSTFSPNTADGVIVQTNSTPSTAATVNGEFQNAYGYKAQNSPYYPVARKMLQSNYRHGYCNEQIKLNKISDNIAYTASWTTNTTQSANGYPSNTDTGLLTALQNFAGSTTQFSPPGLHFPTYKYTGAPGYEMGLDGSFPPSFCNNSPELTLSAVAPQIAIDVGQTSFVTPTNTEIHVPLMSSVIGHLVPKEHYRLVPLQAFGEMQLILQLSQYAFFTSIDTADTTARQYALPLIQLQFEVVYFDKAIRDAIYEAVVTTGIYWNTIGWCVGPVQSFQGSSVPSSTQINMAFKSLYSLVYVFLSKDYMASTAARKHFRLSCNLIQAQVALGSEYYPNTPIIGHSGCVFNTQGKGNANEFYMNMMKTFFRFPRYCEPGISLGSYCVNTREWTTSATERANTVTTNVICSATGTTTGGGYTYAPGTINNTLAQRQYYWEQLRGKFVGGFDLSALNDEKVYWTGVDTVNKIPFQLNLQSDSTNPYYGILGASNTSGNIMYTFMKFGQTIYLGPRTVEVIGRA